MNWFPWRKRQTPPPLPPVVLQPGELITCSAGHVVAEVLKPIRMGMLYGDRVGCWRLEQLWGGQPPVVGQAHLPRCRCGALFWHPVSQGFHVAERGWVPPVPE